MKKELLRNVNVFKDLKEGELKVFSKIVTSEKYKDGEIIIEEGGEGDSLYIVEEGVVLVSKLEGEIRAEIVTLSRGEQFGEMSLLEDARTSARVSAKGDVKLLRISRDDFTRVLSANDALSAKVYHALALSLSRRLRHTSDDLVTWKPSFEF